MRFPLMGKVLAIGLVAAVVAMVQARIGFLVDERAARQQEAIASVQASFAGAQTVLGPMLLRDCVERWDVTIDDPQTKVRRTDEQQRSFRLMATPTTLDAQTDVTADARYRGLFKVNGYRSQLRVSATWAEADLLLPQREHAGSRFTCEPVRLTMALSDVRGVQQAVVAVAGQALAVRPGSAHEPYPSGFHAVLPASLFDHAGGAASGEPLHAEVTLQLAGTARLALVPLADDNRWTLRSDWPHPSFGGRFLPTDRQVRDDGFEAHWQVSSLATSAADAVLAGAALCDGDAAVLYSSDEPYRGASARGRQRGCPDTLDVSFIDPVNPYSLSDRAVKYGLLFVALTFGAVALAEVLARDRVKRVHPVQYGLVGLALSLFFLLLLSLSEHLSFDAAYAVASAACVAVLALYARFMLGRPRDGAWFGAGMAVLYGLVWVLLQREQTALLIGSIGLFLAVTAVMWLTRRVDWYQLVDEARKPERPLPVAMVEPPASE